MLAAEDTAKVVYEAKPLCGAMLRHGARLRGVSCDLKIAAYLLDPGASGGYSLKDIVSRYLDAALDGEAADAAAGARAGLKPAPTHGPDGEAPDGGSQGDLLNPGDEDREQAARRRRLAAEAAAVQAAAPVLERRLREAGSWELARTLEFPLTEVLARMEHAGILVDDAYLSGLNQDLGERMTLLQAKVQEHAGESFNVNSHPQLTHILFDKLGLPKTKKIKTGYSTDAAELGKLAGRHPIIDTLLEYREVAKLRTGFTDSLLSLVNAQTGRIHTTYEQAAAATGRLSSSAPNLQNIPIRADLGRQIRRAFVAPPDNVLLSADYSQIELRVLAHLSEDASFLAAFAQGHDFHATTAAKVFEVDLQDVTSRCAAASSSFPTASPTACPRSGCRSGWASRWARPGNSSTPITPSFRGQGVPGRAGGAGQGRRFRHHHVRPAALSAGASVANFRMRAVGERMALTRRSRHCGRHHEAGDDRRGPGAPGGAGGAHAAHGP